jgi:alkylation response protein AidB-like acyl-CoA dehydrogenase
MAANLKKELCEALAGLFGGKKLVVSALILTTYGEVGDGKEEFRGKALQCTAKQTDKSWIINGQDVRPIASGSVADIFGVMCSVEGSDEPVFILVPGTSKGLSRGEVFKKTGLAASLNSNISLDKVKVPAANCVWQGEASYQDMMSWFYLALSAVSVGSLLATYEIMKQWGDDRFIKGDTFKENPLTASLMAEIASEVSTSRMLTYDLAGMLAQPDVYGGAGGDATFTTATMVAHHVMQAGMKATNSTMELMASAGYAKEWQLERYWRDIKTIQMHVGAYEIAKMDIARYFYDCHKI